MAANHRQAIRCIGIATGGGDDPGLNALMRALRKLLSSNHHWKVSAIPDGFDGLIRPEKSLELTLDRVRILPRRNDSRHYEPRQSLQIQFGRERPGS
jgi:6-phosphofructokinase